MRIPISPFIDRFIPIVQARITTSLLLLSPRKRAEAGCLRQNPPQAGVASLTIGRCLFGREGARNRSSSLTADIVDGDRRTSVLRCMPASQPPLPVPPCRYIPPLYSAFVPTLAHPAPAPAFRRLHCGFASAGAGSCRPSLPSRQHRGPRPPSSGPLHAPLRPFVPAGVSPSAPRALQAVGRDPMQELGTPVRHSSHRLPYCLPSPHLDRAAPNPPGPRSR